MAERITSIEMQAFRGVPGTLTVDFPKGDSCVVLGDNGTGKSTIADAVEWYFRGQIDFLQKEGRGDAVRHTGAADEIETTVAISTDGALGGEITATVKSPQNVRDVGRSELFLLRGRTLVDFVDKTKGEKWQALAELLGLEAIDQMRLDLQRVKNELESAAQSARAELRQRESVLVERVAGVSEDHVFQAMKDKCAAAAVEPPDSLDAALDPRWLGAVVPEGSSDELATVLRTAQADLKAAIEEPLPLDAIDNWNQFLDGAERFDQLQLRLYQTATSVIGSGLTKQDQCPLCGQPVDLAALARTISDQLDALEGAAQALESARQSARLFLNALGAAYQTRLDVSRRAGRQGVGLPDLPAIPRDDLGGQIEAVVPMDRNAAERYQRELAAWDTESLRILDASIPAPATAREQMLMEIGVLHSEASAWRSAVRRERDASAAFDLANRVFLRYQHQQHDHFSHVIDEISGRVAEIYQFLHPEVGATAVAVETVGEKGAELSVEFHGRKELPPQAVLSESHLNSLGLGLFLAMAETFNEQLGFILLDDVVNSFDREHRGRLAELLVEKFERSQLIALTHDEQFFTHIANRAPSWVRYQFTSWSYEDGPRTRQYAGDRLILDATARLGDGDRIGGGQKGRRALEEFLQEACERLEAPLPFRRGFRNDQRTPEEVMRGLRRALREHAPAMYRDLETLLNAVEADLQAVFNAESHASQKGTSDQEVTDALGRIRELRSRFTCSDCGTLVWHAGTPAAARCRCGRAHFPPPTS